MTFKSPNYTQIPNDLLGNFSDVGLMADMGLAELKVLLALSRLTFGYHRHEVDASLSVLERMTGLSRHSVIDGAKALQERGLVIKHSVQGKTSHWELKVASEATSPVNPPTSEATSPVTSEATSPYKESIERKRHEESDLRKSRAPSEKSQQTSFIDEPEPEPPKTNGRAHFVALAEICRVDLSIATQTQKRQVGQSAKLLKVKADATIEDLVRFGEWWYREDWRGKQGDPPKPAQVREEWGKFKEANPGVIDCGW